MVHSFGYFQTFTVQFQALFEFTLQIEDVSVVGAELEPAGIVVQLLAQRVCFEVIFTGAVEAVVFIILPVFNVSQYPVGILPAGLKSFQNGDGIWVLCKCRAVKKDK
ncbi:hypothetical protein D3C86_1873190 [compost metagenome]